MTTNDNRIQLTGTLSPLEVRTADGTLIVSASLAVPSRFQQGDTWYERTELIRLVASGTVARRLARLRGQRIIVVGQLQSSLYIDRDGAKRSGFVQVVVSQAELAPQPQAVAS